MRTAVSRSVAAVFSIALLALAAFVSLARVAPLAAQTSDTADVDAVRAVVTRALERVSAEDMVGLTDLMLTGAVIGSVAERNGRAATRLRTRDAERAASSRRDIVERAFDVEVRLSGPLAMAWAPYDFYVDGAWSHCGVDVFTLFRTHDGWRIASLTYSVEQPPACRKHPEGPPATR